MPGFADNLAAMHLLRENLHLANPTRLGLAEFTEEIPTDYARAVSPFFANTLPDAAIISRDPAKRRAQLDAAIAKIKKTRDGGEGGEGVLGEIGHNLKGFLTRTLPIGLATAAAFRAGHSTYGNWKQGLRPLAWLKDKAHLKELGHHLQDDAAMGLVPALLHSAGAPLMAKGTQVSDEALEHARSEVERNPYLSGLPSGSILASMNTPSSAGKRMLLGGGLGLGLATLAATGPSKMRGLLAMAGNLKNEAPLLAGLKENVLPSLIRDVRRAAPVGLGVGALGGLAMTPRVDGGAPIRTDARAQT